MTKVVLFCQMLLVASYARVLWGFWPQGMALARRRILTVPGAFWWLAAACAAFPVRWWFVSGIVAVQSTAELASWAALHVLCAVAAQALYAAVRDDA